jgi:hypothetical protein
MAKDSVRAYGLRVVGPRRMMLGEMDADVSRRTVLENV